MLTRLRQTDNVESGSITCTVTGRYPQTWISKLPVFEGSCQAVYDAFTKNRFTRSKYMVPPLNDVLMSKAKFSVSSVPVSYDCTVPGVYPSTQHCEGANLGAVIFNHPSFVGKIPTRSDLLGFTQVDSKMASYLLQRAYSRMSSAEYDLGPTIGEVAETASMLAGPLRGIVRTTSIAFAGCSAMYNEGTRVLVRIARNATAKQRRVLTEQTVKHPFNSSLRIIDESANHWLAYKFGVCPFLDDVNKVLEIHRKEISPQFGLRVAKVKGRLSDVTTSEMRKNDVYNYMYFDTFAIRRETSMHTCGLYWRNNIQAPLINFMETIGLSPFQLPSLAYELVPLSFVVDRFIDIKSFVRGNIGSLSKDTFGNYVTHKHKVAFSGTVSNIRLFDKTYPTMQVNQNLAAYSVLSRVARSVSTIRPNFPVINPLWREQLSADATNMALIWGRLRTFVGKRLR